MNFFKRQLRTPGQEDFIVKQEKQKKDQVENLDHLNIKYYQEGNKGRKGLQEDEQPIPISPVLGPIRISNPKVEEKKYRWCSCGMSLNQPWCDNNHKGTSFLPIRFKVEEKVKHIDLCGCKLSQNPPFCDGITCCQLKNPENALRELQQAQITIEKDSENQQQQINLKEETLNNKNQK